jgi:hypothetical protein
MKIFGVSVMTVLIVAASLWVGFKYGSRIPLLKSM